VLDAVPRPVIASRSYEAASLDGGFDVGGHSAGGEKAPGKEAPEGDALKTKVILISMLAAGSASPADADPAPAPAPAPRRLNNLVVELLETPAVAPDGMKFVNPREGWVFFRSKARVGPGGSVAVTLDGRGSESRIIAHGPSGPETIEAMRCLSQGEHTVFAAAQGEGTAAAALTVRAIPEIIYANYPLNPHLKEYGAYDWAYLRRIGMLDCANVIIGSPQGSELEEWLQKGRKLIQQTGVPGLRGPVPSADECAKTWAEAAGMTDPSFAGIIMDEFYPSLADRYPVWIEALGKLTNDRPGRWLYPYIAGDPRGLLPFVKPLAGSTAFRFAYERYLREQPTEAAARETIEKRLREDLLEMEKEVPNLRRKVVYVLGLLCGPPETLNADPATSYKVFMDMQLHLLATDPALEGLYGIEEYLVSYADEEYLRWAAKLYRHYAIEGRAERLTKDPYMLPHIRNPDFEKGLDGWTVRAAGEGSVATKSLDGLGWLEGRWPRGPKGDAFLWTVRSAAKPNLVSQRIRELEPGRAYSLKMYAGDRLDLTREQKHAVSVEIDGAEMVPERSFQAVFPSCYDHHIEKYGEQRACCSFFRLVFRAKSPEAELTISDWTSEKEPGGPPGQELMINFVQVEPYLMPDETG
jgi:hypothetical protein